MIKKTTLITILAVAAIAIGTVFGVRANEKQAAEDQRIYESEQARDAEQLALVRSYLTETYPEKLKEAYENSDSELIKGAECSVRFKTGDETEGAETEDEFHGKFQGICTVNLTVEDSFDELNTYEQSQKLQDYARDAFWQAKQLFYEFPDYAYMEGSSSYPLYLVIGDTTIDFNHDWEFDIWAKTLRNTYEYYAFGAPMFDGYEINGKYTAVKDEDKEAATSKKSGSSGGSSSHSYSGSSSGSYSSSSSDYSSADDYADDNYEDYMDSGEFDNEDDAWDAAYEDFEDGDADW